MAYADYEHCPRCDAKVIYIGDVDVPDDVSAWHDACFEAYVQERIADARAVDD